MDKYYDVLAEVPRVRKDFGYPPLVTPTSQIVGTQAVMNVLAGERYKMVTKESKALLRGEYGSCPRPSTKKFAKSASATTRSLPIVLPTTSRPNWISTARRFAITTSRRRTC